MTCDTGGCIVSEGCVIDNNMLTLPEGLWGQCPRGGSREQVAFPTIFTLSPAPGHVHVAPICHQEIVSSETSL